MKLTIKRKKSSQGVYGAFVALVEQEGSARAWYDIGIWVELDTAIAIAILEGKQSFSWTWGLSEWEDYDHYTVNWLEPASWMSLLVVTGISKQKLYDMIEAKQNEIQADKEKYEDGDYVFFKDQGPRSRP